MPHAATDIHDVRNDVHDDEFKLSPLITLSIVTATSVVGWSVIIMGIRAIFM